MKIKIPKNRNLNYIKKYFKSFKLDELSSHHFDHYKMGVNDVFSSKYYSADLRLLYRLHQIIILNKRTTIFEMGSGWSSLVFSSALIENKKRFAKEVKKLRRNNSFELFILENIKKYRKLNENKNNNFLKKHSIKIKTHWLKTEAKMVNYNGMLATEYDKLPLCSPDFIYVDGPSQFSIKNKINNFSTAHKDVVPVGCDLLKIEYFLTPGTIIVVDGRAATAKFLIDNFKRTWVLKKDKNFDQYIFLLNDNSWGKWNDLQLKFYKKKEKF
jgi:hypothetical protein